MLSFRRSGAHPAATRLHAFPRGLQPLSLAGSSGLVLTAGCAATIVVVTVVESIRPGLTSLGSLLFLPVLAAAWLVETRQAMAVSAFAVVARMFGHSISGVEFGTALAETAMILALAITARLAARSLVDQLETDARVREQEFRLESLTRRETLAARVNDAAIRRLFGLSISLEALSELLDDVESKERLSAAVRDIDALCADLRSLVLEPDRDTAPADSRFPSPVG